MIRSETKDLWLKEISEHKGLIRLKSSEERKFQTHCDERWSPRRNFGAAVTIWKNNRTKGQNFSTNSAEIEKH